MTQVKTTYSFVFAGSHCYSILKKFSSHIGDCTLKRVNWNREFFMFTFHQTVMCMTQPKQLSKHAKCLAAAVPIYTTAHTFSPENYNMFSNATLRLVPFQTIFLWGHTEQYNILLQKE